MWLELLAIAAAGGVGAGARYIVDVIVMKGRTDAFPLGILIVNVSGALLLGLLTGIGSVVAPLWGAILGVGLLGGYTTFSTVSVESALLARRGRRDWAVLDLVVTLLAATAAAALGMVVGGLLPR